MPAWSEVIRGDRSDCVRACTELDIPDSVKSAIEGMLAAYPTDKPVAKRLLRRPKDASRPIDTAHSSDGSTHAVGNYEDIAITHEGVYRVTLHGNPDDYGTVLIQIDPDFSAAVAAEQVTD